MDKQHAAGARADDDSAAPPATASDEGNGTELAGITDPSSPSSADAAVVDSFRIAFGERCAAPADWFRIAQPSLVAETREAFAAEVRRLGIPRAVAIAFPSFCRTKSKWLRLYLSDLQGAMAEEPEQTTGPPQSPDWAAVIKRASHSAAPWMLDELAKLEVERVNGKLLVKAHSPEEAKWAQDRLQLLGGWAIDALGDGVAVEVVT